MDLESPVIDLERSAWRRIAKRIYEPPINWEAVPLFLFACVIVLWFAAQRTVREGYLDPGWLWFLFPSKWNLTGLL
jgi:hypothetical protein